MGGLFGLLYALHGLSAATFWLMLVCAFFALITLMDWKYRIVLNVLTYPGLIAALLINLVVLRQPVMGVLIGLAFAFIVLYLVALILPGGLGNF